jgi:putative MATE family efflux protein
MQHVANVEELENQKISKLLWQYALPAIIGTMVNSLYNVIDRVFIGHWVGDDALAGLGLVLPIMNITAAVGMLVGAGSASRISIYLGKKDINTAEKIAGTSFLMTLILTGIVVALLMIFLKPVLTLAGASEATYPHARDFLMIFLPGNIFLSLCFNFNNMMRASGYPKKAMITMLISVVANIILAPIFIHYLGWGMKGAATATLIAMIIGFAFVMQHFLNPNSFIKLRWKNLRLNSKIVWAITSIGMSPFLMQVATSGVVFFIISQLKRYTHGDSHEGDMAIGAYTIANTLVMLISMLVIGLTQGMQPIVGYNYGAKKYARVKETLLYTIKVGVGITTFGFIIGMFLPKAFVGLFGPSEMLANKAAEAIRIVVICFPLVGFQIVVSSFFQCIGQAGKSIFMSLTRQFFFLIPGLYLLPYYYNVTGIWISIPVSDFLATITAVVLFIMQMRVFRKEEANYLKQG